MTQTYVSTSVEEPQLDEAALNDLAQINRETIAIYASDLHERGYAWQELQTEIEAYNQGLPWPLPLEDIQAILSKYAEETPPAAPDDTTLFERALKEKSIAKLYELASQLATLKRLQPLQYALALDRIRNAFGKSLNWRDFNPLITYEERKQKLAETGVKPSVADVAQAWSMQHRDVWAWDEIGQCWRMWNESYWEEQADKSSFLDQYAVVALQEAGIPVNSSNILNTFQRVAISHCKQRFLPVENKVNFANGTLDLTTMEIRARHEKEDYFTYCLPYSYDPYGDHAQIDAFLGSMILESQKGKFTINQHGIQSLMAHIGLSLIGDRSLHRAILVLGATGSGKSTLLDLANQVCGIAPKEYVPFDVFSRDLEGKRARFQHVKKRIACVDEVPCEAFQEEEIVKQMMAHSGVPMRGMNKDDHEKNQWIPKLLMNGNDDPQYTDVSGALKRRLIVIRCPVQRFDEPEADQPQANPLLMKTFLPELGAFAASCIHYALQVRQRAYYPQSAAMKRDLDKIASIGNPLKAWLEDHCIMEAGTFTTNEELYADYSAYIADLGNARPLGKPRLTINLLGMGKGIKRDTIGNKRGLVGIRLRDEGEQLLTEAQEASLYHDSIPLERRKYSKIQQNTAKNADCIAREAPSEAIPGDANTVNTVNSQKNNIFPADGVRSEYQQEHIQCLPEYKESADLLYHLYPDNIDQPIEPSNSTYSAVCTVVPGCNSPLLPEQVEHYPQDVEAWHQAQGMKIEKFHCTRNHRNVTHYLPWFNADTGQWVGSCPQCYPALRLSKGKYCFMSDIEESQVQQ